MSLLARCAGSQHEFTSRAIQSCLLLNQLLGQSSQLHRSAKAIQFQWPLFLQSSHYITAANSAKVLHDCDAEHFHKYTSGRWLWNEKYQLARRYVKFDLPGLLKVSAQAIGARRCVEVKKLPEGNFNKVLSLTMDDGRKLIAKIPNPNAGRPHYTTASEVATIDYVRALCPVRKLTNVDPRKCSRFAMFSRYRRRGFMAGAPRQTTLLEQCQGVELDKVWDKMSWDDRFEIVSTLASYEEAFFSAKMPMIGSLYYAKDLPRLSPDQFLDPEKSANDKKAFVVGRTTHRTFFDKQRDSVEVHRGPCNIPYLGFRNRSRLTRSQGLRLKNTLIRAQLEN
jgi:hypothetical protein